MTDQIAKIEQDVQSIDGCLKIIKDSAGAKCLADFASKSTVPEPATRSVLLQPLRPPQTVTLPGPGYAISEFVLDEVGEDIGRPLGKQLIVPIKEGAKRPVPWSRVSDYFQPNGDAGAKQLSTTSFQDLYGARPVAKR
jgi:hypothetical protein